MRGKKKKATSVSIKKGTCIGLYSDLDLDAVDLSSKKKDNQKPVKEM